MLWNHIKISLRNIRRHKLFSAINILSLTLSLTICLAALMVIKRQYDLDRHHPDPDLTYRVTTDFQYENGASTSYATSPLEIGDALERDYAFVESVVQVHNRFNRYGLANGKKLGIRGNFVSSNLFEEFGIGLRQGSVVSALTRPRTAVLTPEAARRYFGDRSPMGETLTLEGWGEFTVTGVLDAERLQQSHLSLGGVLVSLESLPVLQQTGAISSADAADPGRSWTYLKLEQSSDRQALEEALPSLSERFTAGQELPEEVASYRFRAQALGDITMGPPILRSEIGAGKVRSSEELAVWGLVAFVILFMACFNYTNLSVARALKRAREVGVYKVLGALRGQIITQFVTQSTLTAAASLMLAWALLPFVPLPQGLMDDIRLAQFDFILAAWIAVFCLFTGLLAGLLPAWLLGSRSPVEMLRSRKSLDLIGGLKIRKSLVVAQFTLSIVMIVVALVTYRQSQYAATGDYGFQREGIYTLSLQGQDADLLREEISGIAGVGDITAASDLFGLFTAGDVTLGANRGEEVLHADYLSADRNLPQVMNLELVAGSTFPDQAAGGPESHVLINETAVERLGWPSAGEAVGENVWLADSLQVQIAGVVRDFNYQTKSLAIRPLVMRHLPGAFRHLYIPYTGNDHEAFQEELTSTWERVAPQLPASYNRLDRRLYEAHSHEEDVASLGYYALIALSIACLGLLGMVTYTVEVRTQEVGIRKVLGAGTGNVMRLLSMEFVWLLLGAAAVGLPAGYWIGQQFLGTYAYHVSIGAGTLLAGFGVMAALGLGAIGWQTWQVARRNPVEAIRTE